MFTKEILITLPISVVFLEWFFFAERGSLRMNQIKKRPMYSLTIVIILLSLLMVIPGMFSFSLKGMLLSETISQSHIGDVFTPGEYLTTQLLVIRRFLRLLIFPIGQNLDYDFPKALSLIEPQVILSFLVISSSSYLLYFLNCISGYSTTISHVFFHQERGAISLDRKRGQVHLFIVKWMCPLF